MRLALDMSLSGRAGSSGGSVTPPLTTLPQQAARVMVIDPDTLNGSLSDGAAVLSITDLINSYVGTSTNSTTAPTLAKNAANGHSALRYTTVSKFISMGRPPAVETAMSTSHGWSAMAVFQNATGLSNRYNVLLGDLAGTAGGLSASVGGAQTNGAVLRSYSSGDPNTNVHTVMYSGDAGAGTATIGRLYMDGTAYQNQYTPKTASANAADVLYIGNGSDTTGSGVIGANRGFVGDILYIVVWNTALSASEAWQADCWARNYFGKTLATAGMTFFPVFDSDSQFMGQGATPDTSTPALTASILGLKQGQFANVGKSSAVVVAGGNSGNNLIDSAPRDVDGFHTVTGLPVVLVCGEYYNQGSAGGTNAAGVLLANNNRTYASLRKAADPTVKIIMWTSLSSWNRDGSTGSTREGFNNSLVSTPGSIDVVIPVHTDTNIGVFGAVTVNTATTYFADGIHLNPTGTAVHAGILAPYVHL
jgi:hypothetical protein